MRLWRIQVCTVDKCLVFLLSLKYIMHRWFWQEDWWIFWSVGLYFAWEVSCLESSLTGYSFCWKVSSSLDWSSGLFSKESFLITVEGKKTFLRVCVDTRGFKAGGLLSARAARGFEMVEDENSEWLSCVDLCVCVWLVSIPVQAVDPTLYLSWCCSPFKFQISRVHHGSVRKKHINWRSILPFIIRIPCISFSSNPSLCVFVPELCETLCSNVLTGVLNASQEVGDKLVDGAFVLHCSRNTLSNFNFITFTVKIR